MTELLIVNESNISNTIKSDYRKVIKIISDAYVAYNAQGIANPDTCFLRFPQKPNARIAALPAYLKADTDLVGMKWIASFPDNIQNGLPRASALLILNDFETGYPFACLEGSIISAARTAASAVLGAELINNKKRQIDSVSFIGNGFIAKNIFDFFINSGWKINNINLFDLNHDYSLHLKKYMQSHYSGNITVLEKLETACTESELIVLATTAVEPYITNVDWFSHNPSILNISLRDLSADIILNSINIVDDIDHCLKASTSPHLAYQKSGHHDFILCSISELITGSSSFPEVYTKPRVYSPFGMGMLDIALGSYVVHQIINNGKGMVVKDFFARHNGALIDSSDEG